LIELVEGDPSPSPVNVSQEVGKLLSVFGEGTAKDRRARCPASGQSKASRTFRPGTETRTHLVLLYLEVDWL
jgi:hypothetical protein